MDADQLLLILAAPRETRTVEIAGRTVTADLAVMDGEQWIIFAVIVADDGQTCLVMRAAHGWMVSAGEGWLASVVPASTSLQDIVEVLAVPRLRKALVKRAALIAQRDRLQADIDRVERLLGRIV